MVSISVYSKVRIPELQLDFFGTTQSGFVLNIGLITSIKLNILVILVGYFFKTANYLPPFPPFQPNGLYD